MLKSRPLRSHPSGPSSPCPLPRTPGGPGTNLAVMQSGGRRGAGGDRGPETPGEGGCHRLFQGLRTSTLLGRQAWSAVIGRSSWSWRPDSKVWRVWGSASPVPPHPLGLPPTPQPQQTCPFPSGRTSRALATDGTDPPACGLRAAPSHLARPRPLERLGGSRARRLAARPTPPRPASDPAAPSLHLPQPRPRGAELRRKPAGSGRRGPAASQEGANPHCGVEGRRGHRSDSEGVLAPAGLGAPGEGSSTRVASAECAPAPPRFFGERGILARAPRRLRY